MTFPLPFPLALMGGTGPAPATDGSGGEPGQAEASTAPLSSRPSTDAGEPTLDKAPKFVPRLRRQS